MHPSAAAIHEMALAYTEAWCSRSGDAVAAFFDENAISIINAGEPTVGRAAIAEAMGSFFIDIPDLVLRMDDLRCGGNQAVFLWTLVGTYSKNDNFIKISGWQNWVLSDDLLIVKADGGFDAEDYQRQLNSEPGSL